MLFSFERVSNNPEKKFLVGKEEMESLMAAKAKKDMEHNFVICDVLNSASSFKVECVQSSNR
jgi:hypothetical protein